MKKTTYMRLLEVTQGKLIEDILIEAYASCENEKVVAQKLGVSRFTLNNWRQRLNLKFKRILVK